MTISDLLIEKRNIIISPTYKRLRDLQLQYILNLSNNSIDPLLVKGMLKLINDTDKWQDEYTREKSKQESN